MKPRIAIIGIGHLGSRHLKCFTEVGEKLEVVALCDTKEDRTARLASHYNLPHFTDYKELLGKVDAVSICTPTEAHYEVAKFFLENNIHTFIEKPISSTAEQAIELIKIAENNNLKLQIGHVERFNSAFESIKHFTTNPVFIECHRLNHFPNRSLDIGVVMDLMIHDIDIISGINKCSPVDISAFGINVLTPLEDIATARVIFENGCLCNLTASRISEEIVRKIRIFQKNSYISLDYVKQTAFIFKNVDGKILKHSLPIEKEQPLKRELEHFVDCIIEDQTPIVSGKEGLEALKIALTISEQIWKRNPSKS